MSLDKKLLTLLAGRRYTNPDKSIFEEQIASAPPVSANTIQTGIVPFNAPFGLPEQTLGTEIYPTTGARILVMVHKSPMVATSALTDLSFSHIDLPSAIRDSYGNGRYRLYMETSVGKVIPFGKNGMFINYSGGTITFDTPVVGVSNSNPPSITFYKYVGGTGLSAEKRIITLAGVTPVVVSNVLVGVVDINIQSSIPDAPAASLSLSKKTASTPTENVRFNINMAQVSADANTLAFTWDAHAHVYVHKTGMTFDGDYTVIVTGGAVV